MRLLRTLVLSALLGVSIGAVAGEEVELLRARSVVSSKYGMTVQETVFDVSVKNLGYDKEVALNYREGGGEWKRVNLGYSHPSGDGREVWQGRIPRYDPATGYPLSPAELEFALAYRVNGVEFLENNRDRNYRLSSNEGEVLYDRPVYNANYIPVLRQFYGNQLYGSVVLKNIAPQKSVQVLYSLDGWKTVKVANASYSPSYWTGWYSWLPNPSASGFEIWSFALDVENAGRVEYAIRYAVAGREYWDNNGGGNYGVEIWR